MIFITKGWKNEPIRHSLASKGIKTIDKKLDMKLMDKNKSIEDIIENISEEDIIANTDKKPEWFHIIDKYWCPKCERNHRTTSNIGDEHIRYSDINKTRYKVKFLIEIVKRLIERDEYDKAKKVFRDEVLYYANRPDFIDNNVIPNKLRDRNGELIDEPNEITDIRTLTEVYDLKKEDLTPATVNAGEFALEEYDEGVEYFEREFNIIYRASQKWRVDPIKVIKDE